MERTAENRYATADGQVIAILFGWSSNTIESATEEARRTVMTAFPGYKQANFARAPRQSGLDFTGRLDGKDMNGDLYLEASDSKVCGHALAIAQNAPYNREWALGIMGTP